MSEVSRIDKLTVNEKDKLIRKLWKENDALQRKVENTQQERDNVLCELNRLKFELQMTDLKRLREGNYINRDTENDSSNLHNGHTNKSSSKADRPYCGPGPSGRTRGGSGPLKVHSLEAPPQLIQSQHSGAQNGHQFRRHQIISHSSVNVNPRLHAKGCAVDDSGRSSGDRWRRNGAQTSAQSYELSQDLADKRIEMLERRYGGDRARRAAITIQRAYRHYAIHQKFRAITATAKAQEKRLSRRFTPLDRAEWTPETQDTRGARDRMRKELDSLNRNVGSTGCNGESRRPSRSLSMRDPNSPAAPRMELDPMNDSSLYCRQALSPSTPVAVNGGGGGGGAALIHHHTPLHAHHQPPSSDDSNSYTSSKDMKYLSSEESAYETGTSKSSVGSGRTKSSGKSSTAKKVPPDIPLRSSSIKSSESSTSGDRSADNGSLSSVQSSGSDSSASDGVTQLTQTDQTEQEFAVPTSPVWKRKSQTSHSDHPPFDDKRLSNISENSEDSFHSHSSEGGPCCVRGPHSARYANSGHSQSAVSSKISDNLRKRQYRVGLNLFNKKPERGINYLVSRGFFERSPPAVAKFLLTRRGLSKQMIGEYLGNLQNSLNTAILENFSNEVDLSNMQVDVALRKFQTYFRMPGEAQKIERLMQVFAQRYCQCNRDVVAKLRDPETVFVLAFAIIMLNTDLHTASLKAERRMKLEDFIRNLRGVDEGADIEREMLEGMYHRIKAQEFRPGQDHVTQVMRVQQTVVGKKPVLALPHRRLVCYCRLYEIADPNKKEKTGLHQREVFLFNDLVVVTKIFPKKKNPVAYTFRKSIPLAGLSVACKEVPHYPFLIEIRQRVDNTLQVTFNARNEHDRTKFCEDLKESILEMDEMENLRIEGELERVKPSLRASRPNSTAENRDSGVADMELLPDKSSCSLKPEGTLKRTALSNSLLDIHEAGL